MRAEPCPLKLLHQMQEQNNMLVLSYSLQDAFSREQVFEWHSSVSDSRRRVGYQVAVLDFVDWSEQCQLRAGDLILLPSTESRASKRSIVSFDTPPGERLLVGTLSGRNKIWPADTASIL